MPIIDKKDAKDVHQYIDRIFSATSPDARALAIRALFAEKLDFVQQSGAVSLSGTPANVKLPEAAHRIAGLKGVQVVYVDLSEAHPNTNRVRKAEAAAAAKIVSGQIIDDPLLIFTNRDASQLHFVYPDFVGAQPTLRRLVVERDLPRRTAVQQVANIYHQWQITGSIHTALERAFDVEAVTTAFFAEYKRVFDLALNSVGGFGSGEDELERKKLFVQTLFNRLMFVYFLSRKGWLTFNNDTDYLNALWRDYQASSDQDNFYRDRLYHLFFFGLNNPQSSDLNFRDSVMASVYGDVPFLNGGLFEKAGLDERGGVVVPDDVIEPILSDLFERFNFTVMESTPFDIEVAVDPEMLGKVFEELVTGRHDSGSYYTPRPVVAFMCREALKGYLEGCDTGLAADAIAAFVDGRETDGISPVRAPSVATALESVTVVDPACGSGAYLLGMMQELVDLRTALFNVGVDAKSLYDLKLHVIQRNLYGVDLDEFAVNIAMLRMWLSLAIEYEGETPEPLPNLDFKVVRGDSLLGPDPSAGAEVQGTLGWDVERIRELGNLKAEYMGAYTGTDKDRLRRQIESLNSEVRDALGVTETAGVVDWRVEFAEVLAARKGFDVVIANPPYVVTADKSLRAMYKDGVYGRMNTYGLFIQRSLQILKEGSQLVFINPRTLLTDRYFTNLRKVIKQKSQLKGVVLIGDRHNTFERVLQECIILHLARKTNPTGAYHVNTQSISVPSDLNSRQDVVSITSDRVLLGNEYDDSFYIGESEFDYEVFERMNAVGVKLSDFGLKAQTGKIQFDKYRQYAQSSKAEGSCKLIWAENVQRYCMQKSQKRIGKEWLAQEIVSAARPNITSGGIVTQRTSANEQPRRIIATLVTPDMAGVDNVYSENGTNFISIPDNTVDQFFVMAALNSSPMEYIFRRLNSNVHVSAGEINKLPFPPAPDGAILKEIQALVSSLQELRGADDPEGAVRKVIRCERQLDRLIGSLYGLSATEVKTIQQRLPSYETVYGLSGERVPDLSSLFDAIEKISKSVPDSEWAKLPADGAANYKHYLYGHPKEEDR